MSSTHSTWFPILRGAIQHTSEDYVSRQDWIAALASAIAAAGIEWVPGSHRGRLTSRRVVKLVGISKPKLLLAGPAGSLKRAAIEAEHRMALEREGTKRPRRRTIDFGCEIPFTTVPKLIADGFSELDRLFRKGNKSVLNHYHAAHMCLVDSLGDYRCDLMLMLALTMAGSSATPQVKEDERCFSASENRKNPALFAANLVTRMLWFLKPSAFPQGTEDERGVMRISEMAKKVGKWQTPPLQKT
jgi:hypothetical protein